MGIDTILVAVGQKEIPVDTYADPVINFAESTDADIVLAHAFTEQEFEEITDQRNIDREAEPVSEQVARPTTGATPHSTGAAGTSPYSAGTAGSAPFEVLSLTGDPDDERLEAIDKQIARQYRIMSRIQPFADLSSRCVFGPIVNTPEPSLASK